MTEAAAVTPPKRRMRLAQVYFCDEAFTRLANYRYAVRDADINGFSTAVLIDEGYGNDRTVILCATTLRAWDVSNDCAELKFSKPFGYNPKRFADHLARRYVEKAQNGERADFEVAATVLKYMGRAVPEVTIAPPVEGESSGHGRAGGKKPEPKLLKTVIRDSQRGRVAEFFSAGPRSIMQAQMDLDMSRSGVLSHLHGLWSFHGIGYQTDGDRAWLMLPPGVTDFWAIAHVPAPVEGGQPETVHVRSSRPSQGKPVNPAKLRPFKADSQRGRVFTFFSTPRTIAEGAKALGITENAVKSHLHSMNSDSGVGYDIQPDGRVTVVTPAGWRPF